MSISISDNHLKFPSQAATTRSAIDLHLVIVIALSAIVLLTRSWIITNAQSERVDDEYHIQRGVLFLERTLSEKRAFKLNDPPLGAAIGVLPLWLAGAWEHHQPDSRTYLWGETYSADAILNAIGVWKSLLMLPMIGVVFVWVRRVYAHAAAWLSVGLILLEPSIAAHTPLPTVDVLGMEAIVIASFLIWRYFEAPGWSRLLAASFATAAALLIKHTAIILPPLALLLAVAWWVVRLWRSGTLRKSWEREVRPRMLALFLAGGVVCLSIWSLLLFDISRPFRTAGERPFREDFPFIGRITEVKLPGGLYATSILQAKWHNDRGHQAFLLGEHARRGWWYYFPVVAIYKVPLPILLLIAAGIASIFWIAPKWDELGLIIPMLLLSALMLHSNINIGWRHFMPAELFMVMLASRVMLIRARAIAVATVLMLVATGIDTLRFGPDLLSYVAFPHREAWTRISDSNVDWGQGLKQFSSWLDDPASGIDGRAVYVRSFAWSPTMQQTQARLGGKATFLEGSPTLPTGGFIVVSMVSAMGLYEREDWYRALRQHEPSAVIGHSLLVYDLDKLKGRRGAFQWGSLPSTRRVSRAASAP